MSQPNLILASSSTRRSDLLHDFQIPFLVVPSTAEELHDHSVPAVDLCCRNAMAKAAQVAEWHPEAVVLGADTLVTLKGVHFGKPRNAEEAAEMLAQLSGRTHEVITGVALLHLRNHRQEVFADQTHVTFRVLNSALIAEYLRLVPVLDKAGAYAIQDRGEMLVEKVEGSMSNVIGLPLERLAEAFCRWNLITPPAHDKSAASR